MRNDLTGSDNYYDDFEVGVIYRHARGKTITENEAVTICHLVMNSASAHFDDYFMHEMHKKGLVHVDQSLVYGGVTMSTVIGLAYQDTGEHVIREVGMDNIQLKSPVLHGSTLYAYTEILEKKDEDRFSGLVSFRHYGVDHNDNLVFQGDRTALVRRKS